VWNEVGRKVSMRGDAEEKIGEDERGRNIQELLNMEEWRGTSIMLRFWV